MSMGFSECFGIDGNLLPGQKENRIAFVLGNADYKNSPLHNSVNDARDISNMLKKLGFEVIFRENANQKNIERVIRKFEKKLKKGGVGLFYYAGHGVQVNGINYLIPIDAEIYQETDIKYEAVHVGRVLDAMHNAENRLNIVVLDACRDNPFARSFRSVNQGLARMDAPTGTIIAYSTSPGSVASDGSGRNSVYTKYFLRYVAVPDLSVENIFKKVRIEVIKNTFNKQVPWESSSLTGDFFFSVKKKLPKKQINKPKNKLVPSENSKYSSFLDVQPEVEESTKNSGINYDSIIQNREKLKTKWDKRQVKMEDTFAKYMEYDKSFMLIPEEKSNVWKAFLVTFKVNNPYSEKDEALKNIATEKYHYWKKYKLLMLKKADEEKSVLNLSSFITPATTTPLKGKRGKTVFVKPAKVPLKNKADKIVSAKSVKVPLKNKADKTVSVKSAKVPLKNKADKTVSAKLAKVSLKNKADKTVSAKFVKVPLKSKANKTVSAKPAKVSLKSKSDNILPVIRRIKVSLNNKVTKLTVNNVKTIFKRLKFYDKNINKQGSFKNNYMDNKDNTITDYTTGLMWQKSGSIRKVKKRRVKKYIANLNNEKFGGYSDWRLPTLEELASLLEKKSVNDLHIDPIFNIKQKRCWCSTNALNFSGHRDLQTQWVVDFQRGTVRQAKWWKFHKDSFYDSYVKVPVSYIKAVRQVHEMKPDS